MADLRPGGEPAERGQLILIAAFVLAVTFVGLALIMNAAIYTENLATRPESSGGTDALSFRSATEATASAMLRNATAAHSGDRGAIRSEMRVGIRDYGRLTGRQAAFDGHAINVSYAGDEPGVRVHQESASAFTDASGEGNWSLGTNVENTRAFTIRVDSVATGRDFELNATTGGTEWRMNVTATGRVGIKRASGEDTYCGVTGTPVRINVSAGTVDGRECAALDLGEENAPGDFDVWFRNGSQATGTYDVVHDGSTPSATDFSSDAAEPTADAVLYAVDAELTYRTSELDYQTTVRVAPGETDA